ncbi:MAG TPA: citramalate synthase [Acidimicrobiales bacterium]|nr:citramalate synthase [Acidimicrobiales bacterium]
MSVDVEVFDTTLRDGSQREGLSLSVEDKLRIAEQLDHLGVTYIEGGWPGANPKDDEFFSRAAAGELLLHTSSLVAFGSTRRAGGHAETDPTLARLLGAGTGIVCIVAKSAPFHVTSTLLTTLDEGVHMVEDSVRYLAAQGRSVFVDCEHFFDGWKEDSGYSRRILEAAARAGAEVLVLCDTNGGTLTHEAASIVASVAAYVESLGLATAPSVGVHFHNDSGVAVANTVEAVRAGARHVQGCMNGYGERTGNANLTTIVADLELKLGATALPPGRLERLTAVSHHIAELVNVAPDPQAPFVGSSAFAHKAGLHVSAIARQRDAYEHVAPDAVGNGSRFVVSELAGKSTLQMKAQELGLDLDSQALTEVLEELKRLEHRGYHFEVADGSLELLLRSATGWKQPWFNVESYRVMTEQRDGEVVTEATIKVHVGDARILAVAEGNGPVNALDAALRKAVGSAYPSLAHIHLTDYRVRVLDSASGTGAVTRVLIDSTDGDRTWSTIGVSDNIIEASWEALLDSIVLGLLYARG